jgi:hypothetical protein
LYKPGRYKPSPVVAVGGDSRKVPAYLTHVLGPAVNDGVQFGKPFDLVVEQTGINEVVGWYYRYKWPREYEGVYFSAPMVLFLPGRIVFMGTANLKDVELVVTIEVGPKVDEQGRLHLTVEKVKIGAMNVTPLARLVAKRMYHDRLATVNIDRRNLGAQIAGSLLNNEPFVAVFRVDRKKHVRVSRVTVRDKKLIVRLVPN